jgi:hypothetical protein
MRKMFIYFLFAIGPTAESARSRNHGTCRDLFDLHHSLTQLSFTASGVNMADRVPACTKME